MEGFKLQQIKITEEEFAKAMAGNRIGTAGTMFLKVIDIENKGKAKKDPTWLNYQFTLAEKESGQEIRTWILVPTESIEYNPHSGGKNVLFVFGKLREFMRGFGVDLPLHAESLSSILTDWFGNVSKFKNEVIECDVGFEVPYVKQEDDGTFQAYDADNFPMKEKSGPTYAAVERHLIDAGYKNIRKFPSILNVLPKKEEKPNLGDF